eukprot:m.182928 g.182928  ORF g.182928 m.182928 type:complete len:207 (+) comp14681_c0_seq3:87-707(+)
MSSQADGQDEMDVSATPPDNVAKQSSESGVASKLPLVLSRSTKPGFLIQAEGETDLRGDVGTVGRFSLDSASAHDGAKLDLKGFVYTGTFRSTNSFLVVEMSKATDKEPAQAKIVSVLEDYFDISDTHSVLATETVVEGELLEEMVADGVLDSEAIMETKAKTTTPKGRASAKRKTTKPKAKAKAKPKAKKPRVTNTKKTASKPKA